MGRKKGQTGKIVPQKTLSPEDLVKLVNESGLAVRAIEVGIGMPITTLDKCLKGEMVNGHLRTLPAKWEAPLIKFIREKKAEKEDHKIEVKEVLQEHNIEVKEPEILIPDKERKEAWIQKMLEVKAGLN